MIAGDFSGPLLTTRILCNAKRSCSSKKPGSTPRAPRPLRRSAASRRARRRQAARRGNRLPPQAPAAGTRPPHPGPGGTPAARPPAQGGTPAPGQNFPQLCRSAGPRREPNRPLQPLRKPHLRPQAPNRPPQAGRQAVKKSSRQAAAGADDRLYPQLDVRSDSTSRTDRVARVEKSAVLISSPRTSSLQALGELHGIKVLVSTARLSPRSTP